MNTTNKALFPRDFNIKPNAFFLRNQYYDQYYDILDSIPHQSCRIELYDFVIFWKQPLSAEKEQIENNELTWNAQMEYVNSGWRMKNLFYLGTVHYFAAKCESFAAPLVSRRFHERMGCHFWQGALFFFSLTLDKKIWNPSNPTTCQKYFSVANW